MTLYCVFKNEEIIGRFIKERSAINYMIDCYSNGIKELTMKVMTGEEYKKYMEKYLTLN